MEIRQLRYLCAAVREGSFTRAAESLNVVQPAVSQQIRKLEAELGIELLYRVGGLRPTRAGARVVARAEQILAEAASIRDEVNAEMGLLTGRITLGSMKWLGPLDLPDLLGQFLAAHSGVDVVLHEDTSAAMVDDLQRDKLDLAFLSAHSAAPRSVVGALEMVVLAEEEMVIVGRSQILGGARGPMSLSDLHGRPFVGFAPGMDVRMLIEEVLGRAGVVPRIVVESNVLSTVQACVAHGIGFSILPRALAETPTNDIEIRSISPAPLFRQLALGWRTARRLAPAATSFRDFVLSSVPAPV